MPVFLLVTGLLPHAGCLLSLASVPIVFRHIASCGTGSRG
ncbi:hypothetical protein SXCC_03606 [Gluconacetobacter sp. SXCC-1]|nr:hypothetical protein SXCC_03606 [Gluconacetobacter sp. SXCC-1]